MIILGALKTASKSFLGGSPGLSVSLSVKLRLCSFLWGHEWPNKEDLKGGQKPFGKFSGEEATIGKFQWVFPQILPTKYRLDFEL